MDDYVFQKESSHDGKTVWACQGLGCKGEPKGCRIQTALGKLELLYPHTSAMHRCGDEAFQMDVGSTISDVMEEEDDNIFCIFDWS